MRTSILKLNSKNLNNRIYTEDNILSLLDGYDVANPIYITKTDSTFTWKYKDLEKIIGYAESFECEADVVYVNFYVYSHLKPFVDDLLSKGCVMRTCGVGEIEGNYITDYKIEYLNLCPKVDDAFEELL